jgi:hypothetical protein
VVAAGDPASVKTAHPGFSDENILYGLIQGMAHVKDASDVWRRDDHGKGRAFVRAAVEISLAHPVFIPFIFGSGRNIVLAQFHDQISIGVQK